MVDYVKNPNKTDEKIRVGHDAVSQEHWLSNVINYAMQSTKVQDDIYDESAEIVNRYVTGINCDPDTARDEMQATKLKFGKIGGTIAYHGYQSFAPDEANPTMAHEIGVKLAEKLWGEQYQVVVTTHLDKGDHLHNHFVLNTVSFVDGKKFYRSNRDYYEMRKISDELCREYELSVIEHSRRGKSKHYSEWNAGQKGQPTYRSTIKNDIDISIRRSMTDRQFFDKLRKLGYEIKLGKDITVRALGRERGVKLKRSFGEEYSLEGIYRRILAQTRPEIPTYPIPQRKYRYRGRFFIPHRKTGLRALYFYYLYRLGHFNKKRDPNHKLVHFVFREDIRYIRRISEEARLLVNHKIDTDLQVIAHRQELQATLNQLGNQRKLLRNKLRTLKDDEIISTTKAEITELSKAMSKIRREVNLCDEVELRSKSMEAKIQIEKTTKSKRKDISNNEQFRRCR